MSAFLQLIGLKGLIGLVGAVTFVYAYRNSISLFELVERHTMGTRLFVMEKLELLFIEVNPDHITYLLLWLSFGHGILILLLVGFFLGWGAGIFLGLVAFFVGWKIPKPFMNFLVNKRISAYEGQMVDALTLLSNGLRAGQSVPQALAMVVDEMPDPVSQEFNLILQQNKIGVPLEECFDTLAKRLPTEDNDMFVSSINILRETGGNLAEVFDTIVGVIRERIRIKQKIATYVAQGMMQGTVIFLMPFVLGGVTIGTDPELASALFGHPIGIIMIILALGFDLAGAFVIYKMVNIKV